MEDVISAAKRGKKYKQDAHRDLGHAKSAFAHASSAASTREKRALAWQNLATCYLLEGNDSRSKNALDNAYNELCLNAQEKEALQDSKKPQLKEHLLTAGAIIGLGLPDVLLTLFDLAADTDHSGIVNRALRMIEKDYENAQRAYFKAEELRENFAAKYRYAET